MFIGKLGLFLIKYIILKLFIQIAFNIFIEYLKLIVFFIFK